MALEIIIIKKTKLELKVGVIEMALVVQNTDLNIGRPVEDVGHICLIAYGAVAKELNMSCTE